MTSDNNDAFHIHAPNWRDQIRMNQKRTRFVIASFILLYMIVGFVIDCLIVSSTSGTQHMITDTGRVIITHTPLPDIIISLLTLQIVPLATIVLGCIAIIALWITYSFHDKIMLLGTEYKQVDERCTDPLERQLYNVVEEMKVASGLSFLPKIFIIEADYMNAFASGYSEKSAMVAITRGLLTKLNRAEMQAVMAHELSHIRHMDIKLTLTVAVLTNIMLIAVDIVFRGVLYSRNRREDNKLLIVVMLLRIFLPLVTILLSLYLSRTREYMADAGCVELMRDNEPLAHALMKIHQDYQSNSNRYAQELSHTAHEDVRRAAYIFDPTVAGFNSAMPLSGLFSTHPPIEKRLAALGFEQR